jgi:hypothetical protein
LVFVILYYIKSQQSNQKLFAVRTFFPFRKLTKKLRFNIKDLQFYRDLPPSFLYNKMLSRTVLDVWRNIQWFYHDKIHFLQLHCLYILLVMFIGSFAFYFQPGTNWSYIDALFMAATSVSNCGLSTITMSDLNTWHIVVIYLVSCLGSHIVISIIILYVRRHYFSKRFEDILIFNKAQRLREANKRKFEKNIQRNSDDSLRKRLSFMSTRSAQKVKDEEDDYASIPPENKALPIRFSYSGSDSKDINDNKEPMQNLASLPERSTIEAQPEAVVSRIIASHPVYMANSLGTKETDNAINSNRTKSRCYSGDSLLKQMNDNQVDSRLINSLDCKNPSSGQNSNLSNAIQLVEGNTEQINGENAQNVSASYGIAFAENIERQREVARLRLAQDRKFEDNSLYRSSLETDSTCATDAQYSLDPTIMTDSNVSDKEEMKRVMREPIRISELTKQQRYRLGGAEYRAIVFLTRLVPFYYLFYVIGFGFVIRIYVAVSSYAQQVLQTSNGNPVNPWLFSFFLSMSSFNNLGMSLINSSMVPFQSAPFLLLVNIVLILAGNTAYAIFLRVIIWTMYKLTPRTYVMKRETLRYLLDHPRRCYTTLFPATHTKWLLIVLIWITATEFVSFVGLNYWLPVLKQLDWGVRILDGLFQSAATRNGISIKHLHK